MRRAEARIDAGAIAANVALLSERAGEALLCAVVKAEGYGHGALTAARAAIAGGADWLAVATAAEAAELRREFEQVPVLVMGALTGDELELALTAGAELAVWRSASLEEVARRGAERGIRPRVHVKHDSGMGRLGNRDPRAVRELVESCAADSRVELSGLWTHFATADEPGSKHFAHQLEAFRELALPLRERHPGLLLHAANSAATLAAPESHFDMVRCGVAVYGLDPFGEDPRAWGLEPALSLHSYLADVKRLRRGEGAGYGQTWHARGETCLGVVPIGYGDGVRRALTNNAEVLAGGRRVPVVGTISMDNLTLDLGPDPGLEPFDPVVVIGRQGDAEILAEELAGRLATINYEITCAISPRVPREEAGLAEQAPTGEARSSR